jgi:hypothetical protein
MTSEDLSSSPSGATLSTMASTSFPTQHAGPLISVDVQLDGCATYKLWAASIQLQLFPINFGGILMDLHHV